MTEDPMISIAGQHERINALDDRIEVVDRRLDKVEIGISQDFEELKENQAVLGDKIDVVIAWMNWSKGWAAAAILMGGVLGGIISFALDKLVKP